MAVLRSDTTIGGRNILTELDNKLSTSGGTISGNLDITGNLRLKGQGNYGNKINLGDGEKVYISEPSDNTLNITANKINFITSDTTSSDRFTYNGVLIGGERRNITYSSHLSDFQKLITGQVI